MSFQPVDGNALKTAVDACFDEHDASNKDGECPNYLAANGYPHMKNWDVSQVTYMHSKSWRWSGGMFDGQAVFDEHNIDLSKWDVSRVTDFKHMFQFNNKFNADISGWNTAAATSFHMMFYDCKEFNADISKWQTGNVHEMPGMFRGAPKFNADISKWNVGGVDCSNPQHNRDRGMKQLFYYATVFARDLSDWNVHKVCNMDSMFRNSAIDFNTMDLSKWDVGNVETMSQMFNGINGSPRGLEDWDVKKVKNMNGLCYGAQDFNPDISKWITSSVTDMGQAFACNSFNQDVSKWDVGSVTGMNGMFENARSFNFGDEVKAAWLNEAAYNDNIFQGSCSADTSCGLCGKTNDKNRPVDTAKCNGQVSVLTSTACTYCLDDSTECCPIKCADSKGAGVPFEQSECSAGSTIKSSLALNCAAANCVSTDCCDANPCAPTEVANSDRATTGAITGNTGQDVVVTCDAGYSGGGTAKCAPNAQFNSLVCTADTCTATEVANSDQSVTGAITGTTGQMTTVTCDTGYAGTATFTATCGTEGTFNTITCAGEPCANIEVANSDQAATLVKAGHDCNSADTLLGTFSTLDECLRKCVATSGCKFFLYGTSNEKCYRESTSTADCTEGWEVDVFNFYEVITDAITGNTGSTTIVTCNPGYSGGGTATCAPNAQFNSLVCTADTCTATEVANSDQSATGAITGTTGQTTTVTCDTGYAGTATFPATCGTDGTFNTITCAGEPCTPTEVANSDQAAIGAITGTTGSTTTVTCDTNFHGVGAGFPTTTCSSSGTFNTLTCAANPTCIDTDGSATAFVQNDCDAGFTIKGTLPTAPCATGTCQTSECCDINSCASSEVANSDKSTAGSITGDTGSTTTVTCDTGYAGTATFTATCGTEGTFNTITCAGEPCTVSEIANTNKATTGAISGTTADVVTIVCDNGFSGGGDVVCQTSNLFTDLTAVGCIALPCVHTDSPHSDKSHTGSISGKTTDAVTVTCDAGYTGSGISTCGSNGQFNEIVCEAKSCDATEVKNSKFSATGSIHGKFGDHAIQINCLDGFKGSGLAICGTDGKFNTISCTEISTVAAGANAAGASSTIETGGASSATTIAPTVAADAAQKEVASSRSTTATLGTTTGLLAAIIGVLLVLVFLMRRSNQQKQAKLDKKEARLHMAEAKVQVEMTNSNPMLTSQLSKITV